jgi:hypothetical protein
VSENIDPKILFDLIAHHLPTELHRHVLIAGSLAAAYHHRDRLIGGVINTKDADVVIQPAGAVAECERVAKLLLARGWRRTDVCFGRATPTTRTRTSSSCFRSPQPTNGRSSAGNRANSTTAGTDCPASGTWG